jgi:DNA-binding MurR/RpiR family transcriptional regulator
LSYSIEETRVTREDIVEKIRQTFDTMSPRVRVAAAYAIDNPQIIALHSVRDAGAKAGVHPSTMMRLAKELDFSGYDDFRKPFQVWLTDGRQESFRARAQALRGRSKHRTAADLTSDMIAADTQNLQNTFHNIRPDDLARSQLLLAKCRRIYVVGFRSLYPAAFSLHYTVSLLSDKCILVSGLGGTIADELRGTTEADVVVVFGYRPYTRAAVKAVEFVGRRKTAVVAVTDSLVSPLARNATVSLIVSNESPSVFQSIIPVVEMAQILAALFLAAQSKDKLSQSLAQSEAQLAEFDVYQEE